MCTTILKLDTCCSTRPHLPCSSHPRAHCCCPTIRAAIESGWVQVQAERTELSQTQQRKDTSRSIGQIWDFQDTLRVSARSAPCGEAQVHGGSCE
mmetsp:Transcript_26116/g.66312  ORF Transcript_26116/g.66312 Transcript_26116/m.66312 type:complete len:95 (-) Transcript_26116:1099-1383(-)